MIDKDLFSKILQTFFDQSDEKLSDFAKKIKIPVSTLRAYLAATNAPSYQNVAAIASGMGLTVEQLLRMGDPTSSPLDEIKGLIDSENLSTNEKKELIGHLLTSIK